MRIILPVPPSVNALYANRKRGGRFKTKEYRAWLQNASWHLLMEQASAFTRVAGPYTIHIRVPATMRGDVDNRIKPILDFLVARRLTDDDRHCQRATVERDAALTLYAEIEVEAA